MKMLSLFTERNVSPVCWDERMDDVRVSLKSRFTLMESARETVSLPLLPHLLFFNKSKRLNDIHVTGFD